MTAPDAEHEDDDAPFICQPDHRHIMLNVELPEPELRAGLIISSHALMSAVAGTFASDFGTVPRA